MKELDQQLGKIKDNSIFYHLPGDMKVGTSGGLFIRYGTIISSGDGENKKGQEGKVFGPLHDKTSLTNEPKGPFIVVQGKENIEFYQNSFDSSGCDDHREYPFPAFIAKTTRQKEQMRGFFQDLSTSWRGISALTQIIKSMHELNNKSAPVSQKNSEEGSSGSSEKNNASNHKKRREKIPHSFLDIIPIPKKLDKKNKSPQQQRREKLDLLQDLKKQPQEQQQLRKPKLNQKRQFRANQQPSFQYSDTSNSRSKSHDISSSDDSLKGAREKYK